MFKNRKKPIGKIRRVEDPYNIDLLAKTIELVALIKWDPPSLINLKEGPNEFI